MNSWLKKLFGPDTEVSTKRFVMVVLVTVLVIALFLLMYFKIEVANKVLVENILHDVFWLILIFGGFITSEQFINKWKGGSADTIVNQDVQQQIVTTDKKISDGSNTQ
jgi:thiol:disulfide interchange protein